MAKYKKIYVMAPYGHATGGVELSHQLVDYLRNSGKDAYIVYIKDTIISTDQTINPSYTKYNIKTTNTIEDDSKNVLVLPETIFELVYNFRNIQLMGWWMSVDNRYNFRCSFGDGIKFNKSMSTRMVLVKHLIQGKIQRNNDNDLLNLGDRICHLYQSTYAQMHLYSKGFGQVLPLSDYINTEFVGKQENAKEDIVLYNPKKGLIFTKKIIDSMPNVKFVPLQGLSRTELVSLMSKAKLYIDFGHFPGKDRLPREAVLSGCCVITGKLGASKYYEDVPISSNYKFDKSNHSIPMIVETITDILKNYNQHRPNFDYYRQRVLDEKEIFYKQIDHLFQ